MLVHEKDNLLKKLVDIEQEGKEASYELNKLKDTCRKLKKVKKKEKSISTNVITVNSLFPSNYVVQNFWFIHCKIITVY